MAWVVDTCLLIDVAEARPDVWRGIGEVAGQQTRGRVRHFTCWPSRSPDHLLNWPLCNRLADRTNLLADPGGLIEYLENMETNAPACFYRLKWP